MRSQSGWTLALPETNIPADKVIDPGASLPAVPGQQGIDHVLQQLHIQTAPPAPL